ncbi:SMEK domain-containing protein [uncultured Flavobacterium sp.]|uniref:SMEK domain-containing protein n=1 Tax=uncultured Flavobacterium sp. TaxID=165435 RepID=UPI0025ECAB18|nr:SMEK domain-containing protein [uncultured Flavobacterium sp.]
MPKQQEEIKEIEKYIKSWLLEIDFSQALCFTDINKVSEGVCCKLLNLIYGFNLKDLGEEKRDFPAVDLGDDGSFKISFQITSDTTLDKIRQSLETFKRHKLHERFTGGIKFLILNGLRKRKTLIKGHEDIFDMGRDVLYLSDLIKEISSIYWREPDRFLEIKKFLRTEFGETIKREEALIFPKDKDKISNYIKVIEKTNFQDISTFSHFEVIIDNVKVSTELLFKQPLANNATIFVGDSGCGKSLAAKAMAIALCSKEMVPIILEAKYFKDGLNALIENEILDHGFSSALSFISACHEFKKQVIVVLDGFNECPLQKRELLISQTKEVSLRHQIKFIITTQQLSESLKALDPHVINVLRPDYFHKKAIAAKFTSFVSKLEPILNLVATSMEAKIVGEIGEFGVDKISRYSLFELFIRKKIKHEQRDCIHLLSSIARKMSRDITFSLSLRQVEIILRNEKIANVILDLCIEAQLIKKDFSQISFSHEMLMDFFIADSVTRFNENVDTVITEFKAPRNDEKKLLILGSIEDVGLRSAVLESISDYKLLVLILNGEAGNYCQLWARDMIEIILEKMRREAAELKFIFNLDSLPVVRVDKESIQTWTQNERSFTGLIICQVLQGKLIEEIFLIGALMDSSLEDAFLKMREEAREKKVGLRSSLFQAVYAPFNGNNIILPGVSDIFSAFESGFASFFTANEISTKQIRDLASTHTVSNGQFFLLLLLCRYTERAEALYGLILDALKNTWRSLPGQLQNEILCSVPYCHKNVEEKQSLISAISNINSNPQHPFQSNLIIDALRGLGALEDDSESYEANVLSELKDILSKPEDEASWRIASSMFDCQFDHPYDSAFSNVIRSQDKDTQKIFYKMALRYEDEYEYDYFVRPLIFTSEEALGAECCPFLVKYADREMIETTMPQERLKTYIIVCLIFAKYGYAIGNLIEKTPEPAQKLLVALGELLYWINRKDLTSDEIKKSSKKALNVLFGIPSSYLVDAIKQFQFASFSISYPSTFMEEINFPTKVFSELIVSACRTALRGDVEQLSVNRLDNQKDILRFAIDQIASTGDIKDIILLKDFADDFDLGKNAVKAIKEIEITSNSNDK